MNAGFQGFENPEIMEFQHSDVENNEIGISLYQSEAEKNTNTN